MKFTSILKVFSVALVSILLMGCEKETEQTTGPVSDVTISLDMDKVTLESASIRIRHESDADMMWAYLLTQDFESDAESLLLDKIDQELELTGEIVAYTGRNKSIVLTDLEPKSYYRFICQALDDVTGKPFGDVATLDFRTRRDPSVFEVNDNWSIERGDRSINPSDHMEYDNFEISSSDDETYVVLPIKVSDFEYYYKNDKRALFEDFHSDFGLAVGASQWKNVLKEGDITWQEQRLRSSDWIVFMIGIDTDGELSGLYQEYRFSIEQEIATDEYNRWLGQWKVINGEGVELFDIHILPSENNLWYYLAGWEGDNLYFDTYDQTLMIETFFNKSNGKMEFISQYVNTMMTDYETIDFYFSGTFYYGGNYVVDAMNYKMAETSFTTSDYTEARVDGLTFTGSGLTVPIQEICYFYYSGSQPSSISLDIPNLPLTFRKVQ